MVHVEGFLDLPAIVAWKLRENHSWGKKNAICKVDIEM
jgi:hypothetical protein